MLVSLCTYESPSEETMRKLAENHLPDGRHVATVGNDELRHIRKGAVDLVRVMIDIELTGRQKAKDRYVSKGYQHFGSGQRGVPNSLNAYNTKPKRDDKRNER